MAPNWLAVILVLIISALVDGKSPGIKWAQDKDSIYLTISVDCASNKVFKPTANVFDLTCTRRSGEKYSLNFHLREFIKANESSCKSVRGEEECKLTKQNPHYFDRLVKDPNVLKQTLKPDWARWKDEAETDVVQSEDSYDGVSHIKQMNVSAVDTAFKEGAVVVADIYFPWCTQCGYVKKSFIAAAKTLSSDKHIFAKIDAREDHEAALRYNITCDYKCNFYVLQRDESPVPVAGKSSDEEMIKAIKPYFLPAITQITTEEDYTKFRAANPVAAVALLKGNFLSKATDSAEYKALQKAANSVRGKVAVAFSDKSLGGFNPPVIKVFGNTSESRDVPISKNDTELARNILLESLPFVDEYTWSKRDTYDNLGLPIVHAFIDEKSPTAQADEELVLTVAKQFRKKLSFIKLNKIDEYMLKDFGLPEKFPAVGIALNFSYNSVKYAFEGDMNAGSVAEFCSKLLAGSLSPSFKSEAVPTETAKPGQVQKVVWKTLSKILGSEGGSKKDTLLLVYKPWSQGREKAESVLDKVAMALEDIPGFSVGAYDASKNHIDPSAFAGLESEDTQVSLFLVHGDGSRAERFMGPITQKDVLKFLAKKVEAVKANWDNSVKNKLKKMKEAEAERKREAEARAKEEADRKVEELKKLEELVASAEKVDVGEKKDGGIIKQIISAGDGATPTKGDKVSAHYTGTLLDGTKFDSSRDRGEPFSFTLGQGQVIGCWDQAFATMKKGERAMLTCKSEYAYGDRGSPPKIPSKATLRFDVELISFARDEL